MADNYLAKDGNGAPLTFRAIDNAGILTPVHAVLSLPLATGASTSELQNTGNSTLSTISGKLPGALGQSAMAGSLSVAIASNQSAIPISDGGNTITVDGTVNAIQSGTWSVTDGGGSLTVDGTVGATQSGVWNIGSITTLPSLPAGSATIGAISAITASITPGIAATQLGKAEDAPHTTGDVGVLSLAVRNDTDTSLVDASGDYTALQVTATGRLKVDLGSALKAEDTAHVGGDSGLMLVAVRNDAGTSLVDVTGDYAPLQVDATGALRVSGVGGTGGGGDASAANQTLHNTKLDSIIAHNAAIRTAVELLDNTVNGTALNVLMAGAIPAGTNVIGALTANQSVNVAQFNGVAPLVGNGISGTGALRVTVANDSTGQIKPVMNTTGGATPSQVISAASTNSTLVKTGATTLTTLTATNNHATDNAYLKVYNKATAPTVGTDTPVATYTLGAAGGGVSITFPTGMALALGLGIAITAGMAVNNTVAVGAAQVAVAMTYH